MKFGDYLRRIREEKGWTQPEAAQKAGIEQSYLSKLETGKSYPSEEVFARLAEAYGFDGADVVKQVASSELAKLKEIGDVRAAILDRQRNERTAARGWLVATLALLLAGGACLGVSLQARDTEGTLRTYVSLGVLLEGEPFDVFDNFGRIPDPDHPDFSAWRERMVAMAARQDVERRATTEWWGNGFVETTPEGRRRFRLDHLEPHVEPSPLRWFLAPALALLIGSLGCAFISYRWK